MVLEMNFAFQQQLETFDISTITPNHVIILRVDPSAIDRQELDPFLKKLPTGCLVMWLKPGAEIQNLDRSAMNRFGWYDSGQLVEAATMQESGIKLLSAIGWDVERVQRAVEPKIGHDGAKEVASAASQTEARSAGNMSVKDRREALRRRYSNTPRPNAQPPNA